MSNTSKLNAQPSNISLLENNKFKFIIPNLPWAVYFCQAVNVPGVSTSSAVQFHPFHEIKRHGDRLSFEPLTLSALIDEDLYTWEESFNWLQAVTTPQGGQQYGDYVKSGIYNDGILEFHKNSNLSNIRLKFHNCCITSIGDLSMRDDIQEPEQLICDITFDYDTYTIERL